MIKEQQFKKKKILLERMALVKAMEFGIPGEKRYTLWERIFDRERVRKEQWNAYKKYEKEYLKEHEFDDNFVVVFN